MKIVIDRIENGIAVAELPNGQTVNVSMLLFADAAEGDIYTIEKQESDTQTRLWQVNKKMNNLHADDN